MDALRAHAHSASSGLSHHSTEPVHVEIEPDPEPEVPSPTHNIPRGPSPDCKPDDTECHRSQSAMYVIFFIFCHCDLNSIKHIVFKGHFGQQRYHFSNLLR